MKVSDGEGEGRDESGGEGAGEAEAGRPPLLGAQRRAGGEAMPERSRPAHVAKSARTPDTGATAKTRLTSQ